MRLRPVGRSTGYQFDFSGSRYYFYIYGQILTGEVIQLNEGLTAINTKLGWTLCGEPKELNVQSLEGAQSMLITNLHVQNMKVSDMWDLERIGITDEVQTFSTAVEDQLVQEQFLKGLSRYEDEKLLHAFYVDNCVTSVDTNVELEVFIQQATAIMADAKMELRMWTFGPEQELSLQNVEPISPVLGLKWDRIEDSLFIPFKSEPISNLSKRKTTIDSTFRI
ncbi:uncharacterized protein CEXT_1011 [Caerostris extrusa]|uniref:Peptidase aspartic putative domain-containing protein n=1 Tax=Caerostris extrusa TaxID=172846 RepID=A0AAV4MYT2_CAEEX|nr:uncharacterized protein CEXT_1011 [Caerostris extrusa]